MSILLNPFINPTPLLDDNFNDNSKDTSKWGANGTVAFFDSGVGVAEAGGELQITPRTSFASTAFNGWPAVNAYDISGGARVTVEIKAALAASHEAWLVWAVDDNNYVRIAVSGGGSLITRYRTGAANNNTTHRAYDHATDAFLRLAYDVSTGEMVFSVSGNGASWTELRRQDPSWAVTAIKPYLTGGSAASIATPSVIRFDNFLMIRA